MESIEKHFIKYVCLNDCKSVEGYAAIASGNKSCLSFSPAKTPKSNQNVIILRKLAFSDLHIQVHELEQRTQLHKVVVLQNVLRPVLRVEEFSTATPPHAELHVPVSVLMLLGLMVPPQSIRTQ